MKRLIIGLALVASVLMPVACNDSSADVFFPVQKSGFDQMTAELYGELELVDGYLRVADYLLIWPYGFSVRVRGEEIQVIDSDGQIAARVGDQIDVGGGVSTVEIVEKYIGQSLPEGCAGPYWIVAGVVND